MNPAKEREDIHANNEVVELIRVEKEVQDEACDNLVNDPCWDKLVELIKIADEAPVRDRDNKADLDDNTFHDFSDACRVEVGMRFDDKALVSSPDDEPIENSCQGKIGANANGSNGL
ncbi:uncharacterized protein KY384_005669 [Bacidia gigantensis]|uniref:uncharacterized protein n=1 Tax=Bacidia gigantensis TaxID=2732470 RepID=UPI001D044949|nr:uncharacterized protein KY384_005669 [Bacidia gigantensis]KAG8529035.1 hypothetical protein KY384_005669 [Bacidia gigantensis]